MFKSKKLWRAGMVILLLVLPFAAAQAEPGDNAAVAKARRDYEQAMKGNDPGLQNAMKVELSFQLSKAKEREAERERGKNKSHSSSNL